MEALTVRLELSRRDQRLGMIREQQHTPEPARQAQSRRRSQSFNLKFKLPSLRVGVLSEHDHWQNY
eukprot:1826864-Rhodomonas_salina.2